MEIDSAIGHEIVRVLYETPRAKRGSIVMDYLKMLECGRSAFYKEIRKYGFDSGKKSRTDKGKRKINITDEQLRLIAGTMKKSKRKKRRFTMPGTVAVEIAERAGQVAPGMTEKMSSINRLLREKGISKNQMMKAWTTDDHQTAAFYTPMVSEHPNEFHIFDVTPCTQYYFNTKGLRHRDENLQMYGGKLKYYKETKEHLLRYVIVDHKSDAFYFQYFYEKGEKVTNLVEFLYQAWVEKNDASYIFHGVPLNLYLDKGSANLSHFMQNMCKNLKINLLSHKAGNPRAKGKGEVYMKIIQEQFESRLSLNSATSLEELNRWAYDWMVWYMAVKKHTRTQCTRMSLWAANIQTEHLRTIKSKGRFLKSVRSKPFQAIITPAKTINVDGEEYQIKGSVNPGNKIICDRDYYDLDAIYAFKRNTDGSRGEQLVVMLIKKNKYGEPAHATRLGKEYKRHKDAPVTVEMKAMDEIDYTEMAAAAFASKREEIDRLGFIQKEGVPICGETKPETILYPRGEVFKEIRFRARIERIAPVQSQLIEQLLGDRQTVEDAVIEEIITTVFHRKDAEDAKKTEIETKAVATA